MSHEKTEQQRRWRLLLGKGAQEEDIPLGALATRQDRVLDDLYQHGLSKKGGKKRGGKGKPNVAKWFGDMKISFPKDVVHILQQDAVSRLGVQELLEQPEILSSIKANPELLMEIIALQAFIPPRSRSIVRSMIEELVEELQEKLELRVKESLLGVLDRCRTTRKPRFSDINWSKSIKANLQNYQPLYQSVILLQYPLMKYIHYLSLNHTHLY